MAAFGVVVPQPRPGTYPGVLHGGEEFPIEVFAAKGRVEAFAEGVLPGAGGIDVVGVHVHGVQPGLIARAMNSEP
jgi:hypothetical protein